MEKILFYGFSTILLGSATAVIFSRNSVRAVLFLVLAFFACAGLWLLQQAEFLAITLVLVYVGAVMVLFLFVIMMLDINVATKEARLVRYFPLGILIAALIVSQIIWILWKGGSWVGIQGDMNPGESNVSAIGKLLYTDYIYPFELAGIILLVAIVAAISLAFRGRRRGTRGQKIKEQIAVRSQDRVTLVSLKPTIRKDL
ncbi:MAG: NADH-quinone oxidoreductase subunit J [Gammaproteobacteria bacterium]|nr:NADH-quinone oxidoreductase subunit J [Gammaproteobacteria bacterium]